MPQGLAPALKLHSGLASKPAWPRRQRALPAIPASTWLESRRRRLQTSCAGLFLMPSVETMIEETTSVTRFRACRQRAASTSICPSSAGMRRRVKLYCAWPLHHPMLLLISPALPASAELVPSFSNCLLLLSAEVTTKDEVVACSAPQFRRLPLATGWRSGSHMHSGLGSRTTLHTACIAGTASAYKAPSSGVVKWSCSYCRA